MSIKVCGRLSFWDNDQQGVHLSTPLAYSIVTMPSTIAALSVGIIASGTSWGVLAQTVPSAAQIINQKVFNVLETVLPPAQANDSTVSTWTRSAPVLKHPMLKGAAIPLAWSHSEVPYCQAVPHLRQRVLRCDRVQPVSNPDCVL